MADDFSHVILEPEAVALLERFVEVSRSVPRDRRSKFFEVSRLSSPQHEFMHPGTDPIPCAIQDVEELAANGLVALDFTSRGTRTLHVTGLGYRYYGHLRSKAGEAAEHAEEHVRSYLDRELLGRYPAALERLRVAETLLWEADSDRQLTTIGHLAREALQAFATEILQRHPSAAAPGDPKQTVGRLRAALQTKRGTGGTVAAFLDALLGYWGSVNDLAQRQEHGAQKEGGPLRWEDARRVVFQTLLVMYEIDRAVSGAVDATA